METEEMTRVGYRFELHELKPLDPIEALLPLEPACERRDGDYLRAGMVVS